MNETSLLHKNIFKHQDLQRYREMSYKLYKTEARFRTGSELQYSYAGLFDKAPRDKNINGQTPQRTSARLIIIMHCLQ